MSRQTDALRRELESLRNTHGLRIERMYLASLRALAVLHRLDSTQTFSDAVDEMPDIDDILHELSRYSNALAELRSLIASPEVPMEGDTRRELIAETYHLEATACDRVAAIALPPVSKKLRAAAHEAWSQVLAYANFGSKLKEEARNTLYPPKVRRPDGLLQEDVDALNRTGPSPSNEENPASRVILGFASLVVSALVIYMFASRC